jgi:hypothetical protein
LHEYPYSLIQDRDHYPSGHHNNASGALFGKLMSLGNVRKWDSFGDLETGPSCLKSTVQILSGCYLSVA